MWQLTRWPLEIIALFSGFTVVIAMHYWMAWQVNRNRPKGKQIAVRKDNYLQVYRAYKKENGDSWAPFFSLIGIILTASGFITILLESTLEGSR